MKKLIFCLSVAVFALNSCNTSKEAARQPTDVVEDEGSKPENVDHGSAQTTIERVRGVVKIEDNCGAVLQVTYGDVIYRYYPTNLDPKYRKDGLVLKFAFTESEKNGNNAKCESINGVIILSDVTPVRQ